MTSDQRRILGWMAILMALLCILLIGWFSLEDGAHSSARSVAVMALITRIFPPAGAEGGLLILRKVAHALEYALLGAIISSAFLCFDRPMRRYFPHVLLPCLMVAVADETIQRFVPGRESSTMDILIDFGGALAGVMIAGMIGYLLKKRRNRFF